LPHAVSKGTSAPQRKGAPDGRVARAAGLVRISERTDQVCGLVGKKVGRFRARAGNLRLKEIAEWGPMLSGRLVRKRRCWPRASGHSATGARPARSPRQQFTRKCSTARGRSARNGSCCRNGIAKPAPAFEGRRGVESERGLRGGRWKSIGDFLTKLREQVKTTSNERDSSENSSPISAFFRAFGVRQIHAGTERSGAAGDDASRVMYTGHAARMLGNRGQLLYDFVTSEAVRRLVAPGRVSRVRPGLRQASRTPKRGSKNPAAKE